MDLISNWIKKKTMLVKICNSLQQSYFLNHKLDLNKTKLGFQLLHVIFFRI